MNHIGTSALETERLILRRFGMGDEQDYAAVWDQETMPMDTILRGYTDSKYYRWAIVEKANQKTVGEIFTVNHDDRTESCEIVYAIAAAYRNRGYASEALKRVLLFLLLDVGYNRVQAGHLADNPASGRVMVKSGMKYEHSLRQDNRNENGDFTDSRIYSMIRDDLMTDADSR